MSNQEQLYTDTPQCFTGFSFLIRFHITRRTKSPAIRCSSFFLYSPNPSETRISPPPFPLVVVGSLLANIKVNEPKRCTLSPLRESVLSLKWSVLFLQWEDVMNIHLWLKYAQDFHVEPHTTQENLAMGSDSWEALAFAQTLLCWNTLLTCLFRLDDCKRTKILSTWRILRSETEHCGSTLRYAGWLILRGACMRSVFFKELQIWWKGQRSASEM